ncbi:hypothetical protein [Pseudomonas sp. Au-Pse12]|uniref:hypothetical protein n=1 Tax=Pseudomonas sp. Au-Pse12 TaxID=2906459 RepID=UPI001E57CE13|nr:hypothetical protein [Pseudomonas sp. Au-Pse12]MCE4056305.1 hypothetical protein [Pseudomonas sp. Au-Pse12]
MCGSALNKIIKPIHKISDPLDLFKKAGLPTSLDLIQDEPKAAAAIAETTGSTAAAPTTSSDSVQAAVEAERRRRLAQSGQNSTILTGSAGLLGNASTSQKTLLGV